MRYRLLKLYVWSTLLYGTKTWTFSADMLKKLEAAEMWFLKKYAKDLIYETIYRLRGHLQREYKQKASE